MEKKCLQNEVRSVAAELPGIVYHALGGLFCQGETLFQVLFLSGIGVHSEAQLHLSGCFLLHEHLGHELCQKLLIVLLVRAVEQEGVSTFPAADAAATP